MTFVDGLYGVLQSGGWLDNCMVFAGRLTMLGVDCELRQTMTRRGSDEFHILNEEKLPDDRWQVVALHRASVPVEGVEFQGQKTGWVNEGTQIASILDYLKENRPEIFSSI